MSASTASAAEPPFLANTREAIVADRNADAPILVESLLP